MNRKYDSAAEPAAPAVIKQYVLVVEDENIFARAVKKHLQRAGYTVDVAATLKAAKQKYTDLTPDVVLLDLRLPDGSGLEFIEFVKARNHSAVLVMSAHGELEDAVSAMKKGASDYLKKPFDLDELSINIEKILDKKTLEKKLSNSNERERNAHETVAFIGASKSITIVKNEIKKISQLIDNNDKENIPPTILILGETGAGKDVAARFLHASTHFRDRPFVQVDCASLPKDLIEAELFGHEKGAFTNAHTTRVGLMEAAEDGVLFLDEIGELPLDLQAKLLAVLERRLMRRVGATKELPVQAWFIAATNRNVAELIQQGKFREDLYYRLNVLTIRMPPLRERGGDVVMLAEYFAEQIARRYKLGKVTFDAAALQAIKVYPWPGNAREMKHLIERAILLNNGGELSQSVLGLEPVAPAQPDEEGRGETRGETGEKRAALGDVTLEAAELALIKQALKRTKGNVSKAARELNITRMALRYRIKKYGLDE